MEILGKRQLSLRKSFLRPSTARSSSSTKTTPDLSFHITVRKITPISHKTARHEIGTSPMIFEHETSEFMPLRKNIVIVKNRPDEETSSIMISDDIIKEYIKRPVISAKRVKSPLGFMPLSMPSATSRVRNGYSGIFVQKSEKGNDFKPRLLKRHYTDHEYISKKSQRLFDYNDILSIASGKFVTK
jgi:hypothetical protein